MKKHLLFIAIAIVSSAAVKAGPLVAGQETSVTTAVVNASLPVFLPSNYDAAKAWPVIFFYPGQGQPATTATIRKFTDDRDFIVVGLPFPDGGPSPSVKDAPPHYVENLGNQLATARAWLTNNAHVDQNRVFLGGVSKGGWTTSLVGEPELSRLAGLIILLGGRGYGAYMTPGGKSYRGKAVYIGDGETDNNIKPARQAAEFFVRQGATVTFEEFAGVGHELPPDAARLRSWLKVQADPSGDFNGWLTNAFAAAKAETNGLAQYRKVYEIAHDPRLPRCGEVQRAGFQKLMMRASSVGPGREDALAERSYRQWVWLEATIHRLDDMRAVRDGYQQLSKSYPETKWGKLAAVDFAALDVAYQKSLEATREAQAKQASLQSNMVHRLQQDGGRNDRPVVPRVNGNKIIFQK